MEVPDMGDVTCSFPECTDPHLAKGLCNKHYQRLNKHGDPAGLPLTACPTCDSHFQPRRTDQRYCSRSCKVTAQIGRREKAPLVGESACRFCGTQFTDEGIRRKRVHCGQDECRRAYHREATRLSRERRPVERRECPECGVLFAVSTESRRYCSKQCRQVVHLRTRRDREYAPAPKDCLQCGQPVPYKSGRKRFCSDECARAFGAVEARWRIKGLTRDHGLVEACGLCGATPRLYIDHDHSCCPGERSCGKCVRGFLCSAHNIGLGLFGDDPALLRAAADYVERHRAAQTLEKESVRG